MIERSVVVLLLFLSTVNVNTLQISVPVVVCGSLHGCKVPTRQFCLKILLGSVDACCRHGYLHEQLFAPVDAVESGNDAFAFLRVSSLGKSNVACYGTVELNYEEVVLLHPYGVLYMSNKSVGVFPVGFTQIHLRVILLVIPRGTMLQVDKHRSRVG